mmetsp:Transcript_25131/g.45744  ORF Transcript_25131/g.45744 Transcript_25131/m.45744 type:complete len:173 (-) Transcript_25131:46-564(-)
MSNFILGVFLPVLANALPPICNMSSIITQEQVLNAKGLHIDFRGSEGLEVSVKNAVVPTAAEVVQPARLMASPNGTIPEALKCVLGCIVPEVFGLLAAENFGVEALVCLVCKTAKLDDKTCQAALWDALYIPIMLQPLTAYVIYHSCTPKCPWSSVAAQSGNSKVPAGFVQV